MNRFSISDIENLCGIKAHTLRMWEQRYGISRPQRQPRHHRIYSGEDLKDLLRIAFLYHHKYKISKIAKLSKEEIQQEVDSISDRDYHYPLFINRMIDASLGFDSENFEKTVNKLISRFGMEKCIEEVFIPFLHRIGLLWLTDHVIPAQEHFASQIIRKKILVAIDELPLAENSSYHMALLTPPGEQHEIPLLIAHYYLRRQHIRTAYFGTCIAADTLKSYDSRFPLTHIYMHVITKLAGQNLPDIIQQFCYEFPDKKILVSGPATGCIQHQPANLRIIRSIEEIKNITTIPACAG